MGNAVTDEWDRRLRRAVGDTELARVSPGLEITCAFVIGDDALVFAISGATWMSSPPRPTLRRRS